MITESFSLPVIVILLLIMLWFFLEEVRDLSLFAKRSAKKEVTNLSTLRALSLFEHHDDIVAVDVNRSTLSSGRGSRKCFISTAVS